MSVADIPRFEAPEVVQDEYFSAIVAREQVQFPVNGFPLLKEAGSKFMESIESSRIAMPTFASLGEVGEKSFSKFKGDTLFFPCDAFPKLVKASEHFMECVEISSSVEMPSFASLIEMQCSCFSELRTTNKIIFPAHGFPKLQKTRERFFQIIVSSTVELPEFSSLEEIASEHNFETLKADTLTFPSNGFPKLQRMNFPILSKK